ncbi:MAG: hypothetical protein EP329_08960 [Deltaproteobacteria bacterium]|nr:MAG: hypothetical protein EP329_08960 [Deltaproteobacteria bacterium]
MRPRLALPSAPNEPPPRALLCDAWTIHGQRTSGEAGAYPGPVVGNWPDDLETDAAQRLSEAVGSEAGWETLAATPAIARKLSERARLQPLDRELLRHLHHLQEVCHRPRLHLRVEDERLPVARARRWPTRAVADLVSHPGDWEHRTLRSVQPRRILARQIEDEWNLYENRVAVRLVDRLLTYLARRIEELRRIETTMAQRRDQGDHTKSSRWRVHRIMTAWAESLDADTEHALSDTQRALAHAQQKLQALTDTPLYRHIPLRATVPLALQQTNILSNDAHYRKVAALWRAWSRHGYKKPETRLQRERRRQEEAHAWDRFVLHLVARAATALGWTASGDAPAWRLEKPGATDVTVEVSESGAVTLHAGGAGRLALVPLCAVLEFADAQAVDAALQPWSDSEVEVVGIHVGGVAGKVDADRATGWRFGDHAVLLPASPWAIDSEERMARLLNGWLARHASPTYPVHVEARALPQPPPWEWLIKNDQHIVALRAPTRREHQDATTWCQREQTKLERAAEQARAAKQAFSRAPLTAIGVLSDLIHTAARLEDLASCPVCGGRGHVHPRPGRAPDGSDATWWASCPGCGAEWGLRACTTCGDRFPVLFPHLSQETRASLEGLAAADWPDRALGADAWAQPCRGDFPRHARCPTCGSCSSGECRHCSAPPGGH